MTDLVSLFIRSVDEFDRRVAAIGDDQWTNATPCSEWDVRALVNHVTSEAMWAPHLLAGKTIEEAGDAFDGDVLGNDPQGAWSIAAKEEREAVQEDGVTERTVHLSRGPTPAQVYLGELFSDHVIHSWDLARGIGADETIDAELVDILYDLSAPMEDRLKASGVFGGKVEPPEDADTQTKLLAVFGRVA